MRYYKQNQFSSEEEFSPDALGRAFVIFFAKCGMWNGWRGVTEEVNVALAVHCCGSQVNFSFLSTSTLYSNSPQYKELLLITINLSASLKRFQ